MKPSQPLTERLSELHSWRHGTNLQIARVGDALRKCQLMTTELELKLNALSARVDTERVTMVFIADAGRGKTDLINALFFTDLARRLLPSGAATSRCVTEIRFDRDAPTRIRLLPIETRASADSVTELLSGTSSWTTHLFDADSAESTTQALATLAEVHEVKPDATVARPRWRHAIINYPHPLLDAGLVIIDAPSLDWFDAEPTVSRAALTGADAVILVLDATTGVSDRDLAVWQAHLHDAANQSVQARIVALNRIDELDIDPVLTGDEANRALLRELDRCVNEAAERLQTDPINIVPISAKLGLVGKLSNEQDKIIRSRLFHLERSITSKLPHDRQTVLNDGIISMLTEVMGGAQARLDEARFTTLGALSELTELRQKNQTMMSSIAAKTQSKQARVFNTLAELRSIKKMHLKLGEELAVTTSADAARADIDRTKRVIAGSLVPSTTHEAMQKYFATTESKLDLIRAKVEEIRHLFAQLGEKLRSEFDIKDIKRFDVVPFMTQRFHAEFYKARDEALASFGKSRAVLMLRGSALAQQFDELVGERTERVFEIAERESTTWARGLYKTLEKPLEEAHKALEARADSIDRVRLAELDLAEEISVLQAALDVVKRRHGTLAEARTGLERFAGRREVADEA